MKRPDQKTLLAVFGILALLFSGLWAAENSQKQDKIPEYSGQPWAEINDNVPYFTEKEITDKAYEHYRPLDRLGRCQAAYACLGKELMPDKPRENIGMIKPTGWQISKYDFIDGEYLYNRCHLIAFCLAGENANKRNLITGTRYMNTEGMLPFENKVCDYIKKTSNHVMYRVTPMFAGNNLVCSGVLMEGYSVEDKGKGICFNVFCYNVQPGVGINYANGVNWLAAAPAQPAQAPAAEFFIGNMSSLKYHRPDCDGVMTMNPRNKIAIYSRAAAEAAGYTPCGVCRP
ncbi:MAG: DNA/RNA non-specific endonuclease [Abditibacteriota bacterium]|nr:DNA/RNA non-specific endonuclease [Abditibacteriota bacterium]